MRGGAQAPFSPFITFFNNLQYGYIITEDVGGSAYSAETFHWRYDGNYLTFTKGNTTYQFQFTGFLTP